MPDSEHSDASSFDKAAAQPEQQGLLERLRIRTSLDDVRSLFFWRAVAAEFLGTLLFVLVGVGACTSSQVDDAGVVRMALAFGIGLATVVWATAHVSGGHINPAVTAAMLVVRRVSLVRGLVYVVAQLGGSAAGAALVAAVVPSARHGGFGVTSPSAGVSNGQAFGVELMITYVLVFTVFATVDSRREDLNGSGPLAIGLSVLMCHVGFLPITGSSMNPARSFGPAVIKGQTKYLWVYFVGPILGGILAAVSYETLFAANSSLQRARALLIAHKYDGESFSPKKKKNETIALVDKSKRQKKNEDDVAVKIHEGD